MSDKLSKLSLGFLNGNRFHAAKGNGPHGRKQRRSFKPQLAAAHLPDTSSQTVPLARTMAEKVTAQRDWANGRARNASLARST
jgi:hypothetical protein